MRGNYIAFQGDPALYAFGPGHLFFGQSPAAPSPLSNPTSTQQVEVEQRDAANSPPESFDNPNQVYGGWMATAAPVAASLLGGPIGGTVFGGLMGAHMAQEARDTYDRAGLLTDNLPSALGGAIAGATRGVSGLLGLTPSLQSIQNTYASLPTLDDRMAQLNHHLDFAQSVLDDRASLTPQLDHHLDFAQSVLGGGDDAASATGDSYGQGPDASDASGGGYMFRSGGLVALAGGGKIAVGPGSGLDDLIPTSIEGRQAARLSDGEFVIPADVVSMMGDGSSTAGSRRLYDLVREVRKAKTGTTRQAGPLPTGDILRRTMK